MLIDTFYDNGICYIKMVLIGKMITLSITLFTANLITTLIEQVRLLYLIFVDLNTISLLILLFMLLSMFVELYF